MQSESQRVNAAQPSCVCGELCQMKLIAGTSAIF